MIREGLSGTRQVLFKGVTTSYDVHYISSTMDYEWGGMCYHLLLIYCPSHDDSITRFPIDSTLTIFHSNCIQRSHSNNSICRFHTKFLFDSSSPLLLLLMHRLEGGGYCIHCYFNNSFISNPSFLFFLLYDPDRKVTPEEDLTGRFYSTRLLIMLQYSTNSKSNLPSLEIKYFGM